MQYGKFVTHERPHLDELVGRVLTIELGRLLFPGVDYDSPIEFWNTGGATPDGRSAREWEKDGYVLLGVGGGKNDEHPRNGKDRVKNECCATLMAKRLGIAHYPYLERILERTLAHDLTKGHTWDTLGRLIIMMYDMVENPKEVIDWATMAIRAQLLKDRAFQLALVEFGEKARVVEIPSFKKPLQFASIRTESTDILKVLPRKKIDVLLQMNPQGNVQIFTGNRPVSLRDVVRVLRYKEQIAMSSRDKVSDWRELVREEILAGWHFFIGGRMILNGSRTATGVSPTLIPFGEIVRIVKQCLNPDWFPSDRCDSCLQGTCSHSPQNKCDVYRWGMDRCQTMRKKQKSKSQPK